jgi:hypothetical protein
MMENHAVRPVFSLLLFLALLALPALLILSPLMDWLTDDFERWATRKGQIETARDMLAQGAALQALATRLEHDLDEGSLFHRGTDIAAVQNGVQSSVRALVQSAGATVRLLDAKSDPGDLRRRLTIKLAAEGGTESLNAAIARLEAFRPRLMLRDLHLRGTEGMAGSGLTLELEIDAYADLTQP